MATLALAPATCESCYVAFQAKILRATVFHSIVYDGIPALEDLLGFVLAFAGDTDLEWLCASSDQCYQWRAFIFLDFTIL